MRTSKVVTICHRNTLRCRRMFGSVGVTYSPWSSLSGELRSSSKRTFCESGAGSVLDKFNSSEESSCAYRLVVLNILKEDAVAHGI